MKPISRHGLIQAFMIVLAVLLLVGAGWVGWLAFDHAARQDRVGADLTLYLDATRRWLAGGPFYPEHQLAGSYVIGDGDILYPPTTILLFLPFLVLPAALFLAMPLAGLAWVVVRHRPAVWAWPLMAACLVYPPTLVKLVHLNPVAWAAAAVALGTIYGWPSLLVLVKPSVAPFAIVGANHRSWWMAAVGVLVAAVVFAPMWLDYLTVMENSHNQAGLLYSLSDVPLLAIPVIAWFARTADRGTRTISWRWRSANRAAA